MKKNTVYIYEKDVKDVSYLVWAFLGFFIGFVAIFLLSFS